MLEHSAGKPASFTSDFEGAVELCNSSGVRGWARDKNCENSVFVSVYIDGTPVCTAVADDIREDGPANGDATIRCGFHMPVPERYIDGRGPSFSCEHIAFKPAVRDCRFIGAASDCSGQERDFIVKKRCLSPTQPYTKQGYGCPPQSLVKTDGFSLQMTAIKSETN